MKLKLINGRICNDYGVPIWTKLDFEYLTLKDGVWHARMLEGNRWTPGYFINQEGTVGFLTIDQNTYRSDTKWEDD